MLRNWLELLAFVVLPLALMYVFAANCWAKNVSARGYCRHTARGWGNRCGENSHRGWNLFDTLSVLALVVALVGAWIWYQRHPDIIGALLP